MSGRRAGGGAAGNELTAPGPPSTMIGNPGEEPP